MDAARQTRGGRREREAGRQAGSEWQALSQAQDRHKHAAKWCQVAARAGGTVGCLAGVHASPREEAPAGGTGYGSGSVTAGEVT